MAISGKKVVQPQEIILDHNFTLPPNINRVRHADEDEVDLNDLTEAQDPDLGDEGPGAIDELTLDNLIGDDVQESGVDTPDSDSLIPVPQTFSVLSQTSRLGTDGTVFVDVVVETDNYPGVIDYEVRLTAL